MQYHKISESKFLLVFLISVVRYQALLLSMIELYGKNPSKGDSRKPFTAELKLQKVEKNRSNNRSKEACIQVPLAKWLS